MATVRVVGSSPFACALWDKQKREKRARALWEPEEKKRKTAREDKTQLAMDPWWVEDFSYETDVSFS